MLVVVGGRSRGQPRTSRIRGRDDHEAEKELRIEPTIYEYYNNKSRILSLNFSNDAVPIFYNNKVAFWNSCCLAEQFCCYIGRLLKNAAANWEAPLKIEQGEFHLLYV